MKYVHDGKVYVIFTVFDGLGHSDVVSCIQPFKVKHAGFLSFHNDKSSKEAITYGNSSGLSLKAEPFDYDEVNYVGISDNEFIMISNCKDTLEKLGNKNIEVATWKESLEGNYGECPVIYPAHSFRNMKACKLLRH